MKKPEMNYGKVLEERKAAKEMAPEIVEIWEAVGVEKMSSETKTKYDKLPANKVGKVK